MKQRMIRAKAILAVVLSAAMTLGSMSPAAADSISSDTISDDMIREDIVSDDAALDNIISDDAVSYDAVSGDMVSDDTVSDEAVTEISADTVELEAAGVASGDDTWYKQYTCSWNTVSTDKPKNYYHNEVGTFEKDYYIVLSSYTGSSVNVIVPATARIDGVTYKTILQGGVFEGQTKINSISLNDGIMTGTSCSYMFACGSSSSKGALWKLNLGNLDTSRATDMSYMFSYCQYLTSLDVSKLNTSNATNMSHMFFWCTAMRSLTLGNPDTSKATDMSYMFYECMKLTSLDVSNLDTLKVENMAYMFGTCSKISTLDVSHFDTSSVKNMMGMFQSCSALTCITGLDVVSFNTANVTNMSNMFLTCTALQSIDVSHFNTDKVTDMSQMFSECEALKKLDLRSFDIRGKSTDMLWDCILLRSLITPRTYDSSNVSNLPRGTWYLAENMTKKYTTLSQTTPNVKELVYPYVVTFYTYSSTYIAPRMVSPNNTVSAPGKDEEPTKEGYYFYRWCYYDDNGNLQPFDFARTPITTDINLYAAYKKNMTGLSRNSALDLTLTSPDLKYTTVNGTQKTINPSNTSVTDSAEGWSWDYNSRTLSLNGLNIVSNETDIDALKVPAGTTVILFNTNNIHVPNSNDSAIWAAADLTVSGDGRINVFSKRTAVYQHESNSVFTMNSGTISADSTGNAFNICGKSVMNGGSIYAVGRSTSLECMKLADVEFKGGKVYAEGGNYAVSVTKDALIDGAEVTAKVRNSGSKALRADGNFEMRSGSLSVDTPGNPAGYAASAKNITITGGTLHLGGTEAAVSADGTLSVGSASDPAAISYAADITSASGNIASKCILQRNSGTPVFIRFGVGAALSDFVLSGPAGGAVTKEGVALTLSGDTFSSMPAGTVLATNYSGISATVTTAGNGTAATVKLTGTIPAGTVSGPVYVTIPGNYLGTAIELTTRLNSGARLEVTQVTPPVPPTPVTYYTVTAAVSPAGSGTVTGAGQVAAGGSLTLKAAAKSGYKFSSWKKGSSTGVTVSKNASYTITDVSEDAAYTAVFTKITSDTGSTVDTGNTDTGSSGGDSSSGTAAATTPATAATAKTQNTAVTVPAAGAVTAGTEQKRTDTGIENNIERMDEKELSEKLTSLLTVQIAGNIMGADKRFDQPLDYTDFVDPDTGKVKNDAGAAITNLKDVVTSLFTKEEQKQILAGDSYSLRLDVKRMDGSVPEKEKQAIEGAKPADFAIAGYLDFSLVKIHNGVEEGKIRKTDKELSVIFNIPEEYYQEGTKYGVLRSHEEDDGTVSTVLLPDLDENDMTVTVSTDRFSTYALVSRTDDSSLKASESEAASAAVPENALQEGTADDNEDSGISPWLIILPGLAVILITVFFIVLRKKKRSRN